MDGIIFDVDGTLWDSTEAVARSWNQAIEENTDFSLSLTADWLKSLFGKTMDEITLTPVSYTHLDVYKRQILYL